MMSNQPERKEMGARAELGRTQSARVAPASPLSLSVKNTSLPSEMALNQSVRGTEGRLQCTGLGALSVLVMGLGERIILPALLFHHIETALADSLGLSLSS